MPPGVSVTDIPGYYDEDYHPLHCSHCGGFISPVPTRTVVTVTSERCDGKIHEIEEPYDESTWAIIKDVTDERTYKITWVQCKGQWCSKGDLVEHEPHWFEVFGDTEWQVYCKHCHRWTVIDAEGYPLCDFV